MVVKKPGKAGAQAMDVLKSLLAERQAAEMVTNAKKAKQEKLNLAKAEAEQEIAQFKAELQAEHDQYKSEHGGGSESRLKAVQEETERTISQLRSQAAQHQAEVVNLLVHYVCNVDSTNSA